MSDRGYTSYYTGKNLPEDTSEIDECLERVLDDAEIRKIMFDRSEIGNYAYNFCTEREPSKIMIMFENTEDLMEAIAAEIEIMNPDGIVISPYNHLRK